MAAKQLKKQLKCRGENRILKLKLGAKVDFDNDLEIELLSFSYEKEASSGTKQFVALVSLSNGAESDQISFSLTIDDGQPRIARETPLGRFFDVKKWGDYELQMLSFCDDESIEITVEKTIKPEA